MGNMRREAETQISTVRMNSPHIQVLYHLLYPQDLYISQLINNAVLYGTIKDAGNIYLYVAAEENQDK